MEPKPTPASPPEPQSDLPNVPMPAEQAPETPDSFQPVVIAPTVHGAGLTPISHDPKPAAPTPATLVSVPSSTDSVSTATAATQSTDEPTTPTEVTTNPTPTPALTPANLEPAQVNTTPLSTGPASAVPSEIPPAAETPSPASPAPPAQVFSSTFAPEVPEKKSKKKLFLLTGGGALLALLLAGGFVFGYYLPNTPSHVWSTGLNRTGKALDSIVTSATEEKKLETYKTSEISGNFKATYGGQSYSGELTSAFDDANSDSGLTISTKDKTGKTTDLKVLAKTNIASGNNFPDIYFQIVGLKSLGLDQYIPNISSYDSKWIQIDSKYLESIGATYLSGTDNNQKEVTSSDVAELARSATNVTTDYLLTTDKDKAVFTQQSFVGKETVDGVKAYHYTVGIDKDHAKAYCTALSNAMLSSNAYKKVAQPKDDELAKAKENAAKDCQTTVDEDFKATDTFDLWVDSKYKLVYKVRVYDEKDKGIYTDIGQLYKGDDKLSLFAAWHDTKAKSDSKFTVDTDLKTNATTGTFTAKSDSEDSPYDLTATVKATLSNKDIKFTKPSPTVPIQDVLAAFGYTAPAASSPSTSTTTASVSSKSKDAESKTDINSLEAHIEAYYAQHGTYPTLSLLNNPTWRATNMKGLDSAALTPPDSTATTVATTVSASQYGYTASGCTSSDCTGYTLSAVLSDGTVYTKKSE